MPYGCNSSFWQDYNFQIASMPKRGLSRRAGGGHKCPKNHEKQYNMEKKIKCHMCYSKYYKEDVCGGDDNPKREPKAENILQEIIQVFCTEDM